MSEIANIQKVKATLGRILELGRMVHSLLDLEALEVPIEELMKLSNSIEKFGNQMSAIHNYILKFYTKQDLQVEVTINSNTKALGYYPKIRNIGNKKKH